MKKVVVETECGEETKFYVEQDVESITVDGEEWVKKSETQQRITHLFAADDENNCVVDVDWDIDGLYIEKDNGFIYIKNAKDETLVSIDPDFLKNVKF